MVVPSVEQSSGTLCRCAPSPFRVAEDGLPEHETLPRGLNRFSAKSGAGTAVRAAGSEEHQATVVRLSSKAGGANPGR